jgi:hypothetical protein
LECVPWLARYLARLEELGQLWARNQEAQCSTFESAAVTDEGGQRSAWAGIPPVRRDMGHPCVSWCKTLLLSSKPTRAATLMVMVTKHRKIDLRRSFVSVSRRFYDVEQHGRGFFLVISAVCWPFALIPCLTGHTSARTHLAGTAATSVRMRTSL